MRLALVCFYCLCVFVYVLYFIATMSFAGYFLSVLFCMLSKLISDSRFDLVWFRLSCDHGWIRSGSVNVRKQQQQQQQVRDRVQDLQNRRRLKTTLEGQHFNIVGCNESNIWALVQGDKGISTFEFYMTYNLCHVYRYIRTYLGDTGPSPSCVTKLPCTLYSEKSRRIITNKISN